MFTLGQNLQPYFYLFVCSHPLWMHLYNHFTNPNSLRNAWELSSSNDDWDERINRSGIHPRANNIPYICSILLQLRIEHFTHYLCHIVRVLHWKLLRSIGSILLTVVHPFGKTFARIGLILYFRDCSSNSARGSGWWACWIYHTISPCSWA